MSWREGTNSRMNKRRSSIVSMRMIMVRYSRRNERGV